METKKPVPLWKGIVGTAVSAFALILIAMITIIVYSINKSMEMWLIVLLLVAGIVCLISFIISLINISDAKEHKRQSNFIEANSKPSKEDPKKIELLRKLLAEGKITIEEYDELKK